MIPRRAINTCMKRQNRKATTTKRGENDNRDTLQETDICARADQVAASPKVNSNLEGTRRADHGTATNTPTLPANAP